MKRNFWINLCISLIVFSQTIIPELAVAETTAETNEQSYIQLTEKVTDQTTVIKGTTLPNVSLKVENNEGILSTTQTDAEGKFEAPITKQPANTLLTVTVVDGNNTYSIVVKVAATGWVEETGRWYYYGPDGEKLTGWITDKGGGAFYLDQTGAMMTGWLFNQGRWYFLKNNGAMQTGWLYNGGKWYLLAPNGEMKTGWQFEAGAWYYLNRSGQMQTGWLKDGNRWYYLAGNGVMKTGWVYSGRSWYYLGQNGVMATGWVYDAGKWYFMNTDGTMKKGWIQSGKDRFYLGSSGSVSSVLLDVPLVAQMPELPRGCEVTSLAMLLMDAGKNVSKMTLASQVRRDPTSYSKSNGQVYFGNPYSGFVGDMYTFSKPGLGVYHGPIADLANQYLPGRIDDFTGSDFEAIYKHLNNGRPVWVINNTLFDTVPSQYWQTWNTPVGKISITYKEHSVLITGYDSQYIYFNDPLSVTKNRKATISAFKRGWVQMGKQAITYR